MTVTADDLDSVMSCVMSRLLPITDRDWSVRAGTLEWDCWHTAEHIGDCLMSYAWQLAVQPTGRYVRAVATAEKDASPDPTRGPRCCGPAAASSSPGTPGSLAGAPTPPPSPARAQVLPVPYPRGNGEPGHPAHPYRDCAAPAFCPGRLGPGRLPARA